MSYFQKLRMRGHSESGQYNMSCFLLCGSSSSPQLQWLQMERLCRYDFSFSLLCSYLVTFYYCTMSLFFCSHKSWTHVFCANYIKSNYLLIIGDCWESAITITCALMVIWGVLILQVASLEKLYKVFERCQRHPHTFVCVKDGVYIMVVIVFWHIVSCIKMFSLQRLNDFYLVIVLLGCCFSTRRELSSYLDKNVSHSFDPCQSDQWMLNV